MRSACALSIALMVSLCLSPVAALATQKKTRSAPVLADGNVVLARTEAVLLTSGKVVSTSGPISGSAAAFIAEVSSQESFSRLHFIEAIASAPFLSPPSPEQCAGSVHPRKVAIDLVTTPGGSWFCYALRDGFLGRMRLSTEPVYGDPIGHLRVEFLTWNIRHDF